MTLSRLCELALVALVFVLLRGSISVAQLEVRTTPTQRFDAGDRDAVRLLPPVESPSSEPSPESSHVTSPLPAMPPEPDSVSTQTAEGVVHYALADLESVAQANNPAIAEARARVEVVRGRGWQAGLRPNPRVGYTAGEVGNEGTVGQQGAFIGQEFVRGGKLQLDRAIQCRELERLRQEWATIRQRVMTDVRSLYYSIVWLQNRQALYEEFLATNERAKSIAEKLFLAEYNTRTDVLLADIEYQQTATDLAAIEANIEAAWRELSRVIGDPWLEPGVLVTDEQPIPELTWEEAVAMIQHSPRLASSHAELHRNQMALRRARVEPIPNITAQVTVQYDYGTSDAITGLQIGMPIPVHNRNQGGVYAASANVRVAMQKIERTRMAAERELARKFGEYQNAKKQLLRIDAEIVPKAREVVRIALQAYAATEAGMADVLNAQRALLRALLRQQDARRTLRLAYVAIDGFLLADGLGAVQ